MEGNEEGGHESKVNDENQRESGCIKAAEKR